MPDVEILQACLSAHTPASVDAMSAGATHCTTDLRYRGCVAVNNIESFQFSFLHLQILFFQFFFVWYFFLFALSLVVLSSLQVCVVLVGIQFYLRCLFGGCFPSLISTHKLNAPQPSLFIYFYFYFNSELVLF